MSTFLWVKEAGDILIWREDWIQLQIDSDRKVEIGADFDNNGGLVWATYGVRICLN